MLSIRKHALIVEAALAINAKSGWHHVALSPLHVSASVTGLYPLESTCMEDFCRPFVVIGRLIKYSRRTVIGRRIGLIVPPAPKQHRRPE